MNTNKKDETTLAPYYKYWGKAAKNGSADHLLPYHCLDVAAVAAAWWDISSFINNSFSINLGISSEIARAWVLFFVALHDMGKFDVRFQRKSINTWKKLQFPNKPSFLSLADSINYYHGHSGLFWFKDEFDNIVLNKTSTSSDSFDDFFEWDDDETNSWEAWKPWIEAVTGHHGHLISAENAIPTPLPTECPLCYQRHDKLARKSWVVFLESLFLKPYDVTIQDQPPTLPSIPFLAGFCSVVDWLGSANTTTQFIYHQSISDLANYFKQKYQTDAKAVLQSAGLIGAVRSYKGVSALLEKSHQPRQIQTIIDELPVSAGLTFIEAPTGSGKTEAALAYAWRLLNQGFAESIIFALPSQATANAMFMRLDKLAVRVFNEHPNLLLAHGNAKFNDAFMKLKNPKQTVQENDAWAQCTEWLAQSRKRAFLGQIGVCTVDQVLISVLPVKHRFIRGFGLGKSIIIVDEIHAYDTYMYGLLNAVLKDQKAIQGSVILLSATLPIHQKMDLYKAWGSNDINNMPKGLPYPLISQVSGKQEVRQYQMHADQFPEKREIFLRTVISKNCNNDDD